MRHKNLEARSLPGTPPACLRQVFLSWAPPSGSFHFFRWRQREPEVVMPTWRSARMPFFVQVVLAVVEVLLTDTRRRRAGR
jgi:hypothetical protein